MATLLGTITGVYEAFSRGDVPAILDALDENVAWESWIDNSAASAGVPWLLPRHGKAGAAEFFGVLGSQMRILDFRVLSMMAGESQVAVEFEIELEVPSTGERFRDEEIHLWIFNDRGKVVRFRHYADTAKHIRAATPASV